MATTAAMCKGGEREKTHGLGSDSGGDLFQLKVWLGGPPICPGPYAPAYPAYPDATPRIPTKLAYMLYSTFHIVCLKLNKAQYNFPN